MVRRIVLKCPYVDRKKPFDATTCYRNLEDSFGRREAPSKIVSYMFGTVMADKDADFVRCRCAFLAPFKSVPQFLKQLLNSFPKIPKASFPSLL